MEEKQLSPQELLELWLAVGDEQAGDESVNAAQREALSRLIVENEEARQLLITLSQQQAWLMWDGSAAAAGKIDANNVEAVVARVNALIAETGHAEFQKATWRGAIRGYAADFATESATLFRPPMVFASLLLAAALGALAAYQFTGPANSARHSVGEVANSQQAKLPVAYLTSSNGCNWSGVTPLLHTVGSSVQMGDELALHEGVAEFRMANGVYLGLEGPASLLLVSPSKVVLQYGKLTTHVPWSVTDFQVVAGSCRLNTREAEFGLSRTGNKLEIHVFSGEANVASSVTPIRIDDDGASDELTDAEGTGYFTEAVVTTGRALSLTSHGELLSVSGWSKARPNSFVTKLSMSGPLPVTQDYVNQVLSSKPIAYWRFEQVVDSQIPNEVESGTPLIVKDKSLLVGGDGNMSAELRSDGDWYFRSKSRLPLAESEYSIEVWVKPSHLHLGSIVNLDCSDLYHSAARLELQGGLGDSRSEKNAGALRYVHRTYKGKEHDFGVSCFTSRPYLVRRWQHVVAVKAASEVKLYLDGKLSQSMTERPKLPDDVKVIIGRFNGGDPRQFIGQLDELAIYNRALSEKEIAQHYKTLKRATETSKTNERREPLSTKSEGA